MGITRIVNLIGLFIELIPIILIVIAAFSFLKVPVGKKRIKLRDRMSAVKSGIPMIIIACVLYLACLSAITFINHRLESSITIGLNYPEASKGLNPNGTRFNTYDIIEDSVLEAAIADGNLGNITVEELRQTLTVRPLQAEETLSTEQYYVSTEYVLGYSATMNTFFLDGNHVVDSVAQAFNNEFLDTYSRKTSVLELDYTDVEEADYLDKVDILASKSSRIQSYLWNCSTENGNYVSDDGETFASLAQKIEDFQTVQMESLESYILTNGLTKDKNRQLAKLNYNNLMLDMNFQQNNAGYDVRLETIDMYERDMATIVLVPTTDETGEYYMSRTKIAVDNFADEADTYSQNAALLQEQIENNNYAIDQIKNSEADENEYETVDSMIESIQTTLSSYAEKALEMVRDYDAENKGDYLIFTSERLSLAGGLVVRGAMLSIEMIVALVLILMVRTNEPRRSFGRRK